MATDGATKETVLVVEDDPSIREGLLLNLRLAGFDAVAAEDAAGGWAQALDARPQLVLLDLMLPDGSGLDLLKRLRQSEVLQQVHVIVLTALGQETDKVRGLKLGADDYVTKPFSVAELMARIEATLRRDRLEREATICFGEVQLDPLRRRVMRGGRPVKLTRRELDLLLYLAGHPERVFSREQLLAHVWGPDYEGTSRTVDNFVRALRAKLEQDPAHPQHLRTVHGVGYCFVL